MVTELSRAFAGVGSHVPMLPHASCSTPLPRLATNGYGPAEAREYRVGIEESAGFEVAAVSVSFEASATHVVVHFRMGVNLSAMPKWRGGT